MLSLGTRLVEDARSVRHHLGASAFATHAVAEGTELRQLVTPDA